MSAGRLASRLQIHRTPKHRNFGKRPPPPQHIAPEHPVIPDKEPVSQQVRHSSPAQREALSTPEILVIILSQLPHSSLLRAKRVSKIWASLFDHVEIQAALFQCPRPKGSALYAETHSDIVKDHFSAFWPINEDDKAVFPVSSTAMPFHPVERRQTMNSISASDDPSKVHLPNVTGFHQEQRQGYREQCPYEDHWRQLLICQPPIETLELIQQVNRRVGECLEFRAVIPCPGGVRIGLLYDAVRHWDDVQGGNLAVLWNRNTGDLRHTARVYIDGPSFKTADDKPCVTVWGQTSVGCGQYCGQTFLTYVPGRAPRTEVIPSGDGDVEYRFSEPKRVRPSGPFSSW